LTGRFLGGIVSRRWERVDYLALCEDVNLEGDGICRRWHYVFDRGEIAGHLGTSREAPSR
jgi:hypothetical protein